MPTPDTTCPNCGHRTASHYDRGCYAGTDPCPCDFTSAQAVDAARKVAREQAKPDPDPEDPRIPGPLTTTVDQELSDALLLHAQNQQEHVDRLIAAGVSSATVTFGNGLVVRLRDIAFALRNGKLRID